MAASDNRSKRSTSAGKHRPLEAQLSGLLNSCDVADKDDTCNNQERYAPAENFPDRCTLGDDRNGFLAWEFLVFFDDACDTAHVTCANDGDDLVPLCVLDFAGEELVSFVDEHLLDFGVALAELLHHGIESVFFLDFLELFFADFSLVENAGEQPPEEVELTVPRSASPSASEGNLDVAVGKD